MGEMKINKSRNLCRFFRRLINFRPSSVQGIHVVRD